MTHNASLRTGLAVAVVASLVAALLGFLFPPATAHAATPDQGFEKCLRDKHNAARKSAGLAPLESRSDLVSFARKNTDAMIAAGKISHSKNLGSATSGWTHLGENVGVGGSCDSLHKAFMNSAGHKANILNKVFTSIGVGGAQDSEGRYYVTVVFAAYKDSPTPTTTVPPKPTTTAAPKPTTTAPPKPTTTAAPKPTTTVPPTTTTTANFFESLPPVEWGTLITELIKMALSRTLPIPPR